tara:strand:- start:14015 stop:14884 length:870 start_codon:yes stop_codon:yes gene_type:complete
MNTINTQTNQLDKFYTIPTCSKRCIDKIEDLYGDYSKWDMVIEPSAGNGSFLKQIPTTQKIGLDIEPECDDIQRQDFLQYSYSSHINQKVLVIGNPPFGRISSLAIKFFNHAAINCGCDVIAFIVPRTFRKVSVQNKLSPSFHLLYDEDILTTPCQFTPKMMAKCCFQVWEKRSENRSHIYLPTFHEHWQFLGFGPKDQVGQPTPPEGADFAIRAYGGKIGEVQKENLHLLRPKSWHWIKVNKEKIDKVTLINKLKCLDYSGSLNTARQNSMGRAELVNLYSIFLNSER